jgi:glutamyl-Q tRNA(Asp) synthetase
MTIANTKAQGIMRGQSCTPLVTTRFAPSPTGLLHLGHAYSAVLSHDLARFSGGRFIVRIEDIDSGRARPAFVDAIFDDLRWLGLSWDDVVVQSQRTALYSAALEQLKALGLVYPCCCTRAEIADSAAAPQGDRPPMYPGTCRNKDNITNPSVAWRLNMTRSIAKADIGHAAASWGDVVIARKDALTGYHLAVVVDDADQGVTHVVRGRDLESATDIHLVLQRLLGLPKPAYRHHALILGADGCRLAKREGAASLASLRDSGVSGVQLANNLRTGQLPIGFRQENP